MRYGEIVLQYNTKFAWDKKLEAVVENNEDRLKPKTSENFEQVLKFGRKNGFDSSLGFQKFALTGFSSGFSVKIFCKTGFSGFGFHPCLRRCLSLRQTFENVTHWHLIIPSP